MAGEVTHKDINLLAQKSSVEGTEKLPVSDTQYITPNQIAALAGGGGGGNANIVHLEDESEMPANPDPDTLYVIDESGSTMSESTANKVTSLSSSSTDVQYPSAKCVFDLIGDVETLLAAI